MKKMKLLTTGLLAMGLTGASVSFAANEGASSGSAEVLKLPSGVQVKYLKKTTGKMPGPTDKVRAHYRGTLDNGVEFDSSYKRGQPTDFPLNQVIPCWTEGLQKMAVGSKVILTCPGKVAYGPSGIPGVIPPNATLTFEVELVDVLKN